MGKQADKLCNLTELLHNYFIEQRHFTEGQCADLYDELIECLERFESYHADIFGTEGYGRSILGK